MYIVVKYCKKFVSTVTYAYMLGVYLLIINNNNANNILIYKLIG
jgi:hypothetical protein